MNQFLRLLFLTGFWTIAGAAEVRFYLGTYTDNPLSQGIYSGTLDTVTGRIGPLELAAKATSPNYLALSPDGKFVYASTLTGDGSLAAFRVEVTVPDLDPRHEAGVLRAVKACLIHNTLLHAPSIEIALETRVPATI